MQEMRIDWQCQKCLQEMTALRVMGVVESHEVGICLACSAEAQENPDEISIWRVRRGPV